MNLAVDYFVNAEEHTPFGEKAGRYTYIFDKNFNATKQYGDVNNFYLGVNQNTNGFEYFFRTKNQFMTINESFCNSENCDRKGYLRNYTEINGYHLTLSYEPNDTLLFKLKNVKTPSGNNQECYVTKVNGKEFILTYHPELRKLILYDSLVSSNSGSKPNNILFVTDDNKLYDNCKLLNLPAYDNIQLLSDFFVKK